MARSVIAVIVRLGLTPRLAGITDPSHTYKPSYPKIICCASTLIAARSTTALIFSKAHRIAAPSSASARRTKSAPESCCAGKGNFQTRSTSLKAAASASSKWRAKCSGVWPNSAKAPWPGKWLFIPMTHAPQPSSQPKIPLYGFLTRIRCYGCAKRTPSSPPGSTLP